MPEWLVRELLKRNKRRHSFTLGDELQVIRQQRQHVAESVRIFQVVLKTSQYRLIPQEVTRSPPFGSIGSLQSELLYSHLKMPPYINLKIDSFVTKQCRTLYP